MLEHQWWDGKQERPSAEGAREEAAFPSGCLTAGSKLSVSNKELSWKAQCCSSRSPIALVQLVKANCRQFWGSVISAVMETREGGRSWEGSWKRTEAAALPLGSQAHAHGDGKGFCLAQAPVPLSS